MERKKWYANKIFIAALTAVIVLAGIVIIMKRSGTTTTYGPMPVDFTPKQGEVVLTGTLVCLPEKPGTPPNTATTSHANNIDCVRGLKTDDSRTLALNTVSVGAPEVNWAPGTRVRAVGTVVPADTGDPENVFVYDGMLNVRGLVRD